MSEERKVKDPVTAMIGAISVILVFGGMGVVLVRMVMLDPWVAVGAGSWAIGWVVGKMWEWLEKDG